VPTPLRTHDKVLTIRIPRSRRSPLWRAVRRFPFGDADLRDRKLAARAAVVALLGASAVFGVTLGLVLVYSINLPQMTELERYRPSTTTDLYDIHGQIFGSFAQERRIVVPYSEFPDVLRQAIFSIEDKDFEHNGGINLIRVVEAAYEDVHTHGKVQGASTLTMQLARNLFLSSEKTYGRKLQEIFLSLEIERRFTKAQIFTLYANQIYLGSGTYGFEAGSEYYFSKHARDLTLPEAAMLAALPKGPQYYSPVRYPGRALKRRNLVIQEMLNDRKITQQQAIEAKAAPLGLHLEAPPNNEAPYFVEEVRRQLESEYGVDEVHSAGLRVYTTLDLNLERAATQAVLDGTAAYERRHGWKGKLENVLREGTPLNDYKHPDWSQTVTDNSYFHALVTSVSPTRMTVRIGKLDATLAPADWVWTGIARATDLAQVGDIVYVKVVSGANTATPHLLLEEDTGAQAALMAVNNADGEVLAMVGGRDFQTSQFNRATQAERQVGSSFKPYVYTAAMEAGMKPYDTVMDAPTTFFTAGGPYSPHDYEAGYLGSMTLVDAFAESRNIPALRLADKVGIKNVIALTRKFGITSDLPAYLPVAIGAGDLTLAEQVGAYSVFPNDGIRIAPHYIRRVMQADGQPLQQPRTQVSEAIPVNIAREMMVLLEAVVTHGTAAAAAQMNHALGGKTGTTNNYTDAWFVGFSPSVTCGSWIGFDNRQSLGEKETGARAALPIWVDFMKVALANKPNEAFSTQNAPKKQIEVPADSDTDAAPTPPDADTDTDGGPQKSPEPAILEPGEERMPNDEPAAPATPLRQQAPAPIVRIPARNLPPTARRKLLPAKKHPPASTPPTG
jgi:penicillin-binding protein 1A